MATTSTPTPPSSVETYLRDGLRILAILLVWGVLAAFITFVADRTGLIGTEFLAQIGNFLLWTGGLNAVLYLVYRSIDHYHATTH